MRNPVVRQKGRKSVEEVYGTKFDGSTAKSAATHGNMQKTARNEHGYIITSTSPYNACNKISGVPPAPNSSAVGTTRRRTARVTQAHEKSPYTMKEEKTFDMPETKRDTMTKTRTGRAEKNSYNNRMCDKNYGAENKKEHMHNHQHQHQHHNHQHNMQQFEEDKDEDAEEFFDLIRQTVEGAIGKAVFDAFTRNFRDLSAKIDRFSNELKATNTALAQVQSDMSNKIVHYGEENSRHFRYLCMKSEYDKMFYQHHAMVAQTLDKSADAVKKNIEKEAKAKSCSCRNKKNVTQEPHKTSSEEQGVSNISNKSSEMGMREVLEHIQRFCSQMQLTDLKPDEATVSKNDGCFRVEANIKHSKPPIFDEDDDDEEDFEMSSDGMTPRMDEHIMKYQNNSLRKCTISRGSNGGGDASIALKK